MSRVCALVCLLYINVSLLAQQVAPVELESDPDNYSFALSGSLIGNVDNEKLDTDTRNGRASGRLFLDAYLTKRLFASVHINALQSRDYLLDTSNIANLAFSHNSYKFYLGLEYKGKETEAGKHSWFANYSISGVHIEDSLRSITPDLEFTLYRINLGVKFRWKADWDQNLLVHGSLKFNRFWIEDPAGRKRSLETAFGIASDEKLVRVYNGFGMKMIIQLNNISIFFETQANYPIKEQRDRTPIPGFVDHTFYSIGFTSNSTAILGKRKKKEPTSSAKPLKKKDAPILKKKEPVEKRE